MIFFVSWSFTSTQRIVIDIFTITLSLGSGVLQRKVEYDLGTLLDNVLAAHKIWEADRSFLIADKVREERRQKVTF